MPFRGILSGLLTNQYVIVFRAPAARSCESVEGFCALQAHKTLPHFHETGPLASLAGEEASCENPWISYCNKKGGIPWVCKTCNGP